MLTYVHASPPRSHAARALQRVKTSVNAVMVLGLEWGGRWGQVAAICWGFLSSDADAPRLFRAISAQAARHHALAAVLHQVRHGG